MQTPRNYALMSIDYVKYVARQMGVTVSQHQWDRLALFLTDMFDDSINDPLNTAFCASDSDDPEIPDPPKIRRQVPILSNIVIWKPHATCVKLRPAKVTNIWA